MSRKIVLPVVDLPQPDSPTRPSVSPSAIEKLTSATRDENFTHGNAVHQEGADRDGNRQD